jgi:mannan endo-1,4-beta-mannosidase
VKAGKLYDTCGERVILKGVNQLGQYIDEGGASMAEIAKTGANAVRIFWYVTRGQGVAGMEPLIKAALANRLVPILEAHDSTCAWTMDGIEAAWTTPAAVALIKKYQRHVIVNIANEANAPDLNTFTATYSRIIKKMRAAGVRVPLMIDAASRCGRDWQSLLNQGRALLAADPERNLIFSAHLYDPMSAEAYAAAFRQFNDLGLAFVVGEFANREPPGCGRSIDYRALIREAQRAEIGWLAWSWGDNNPGSDWNGDCPLFDMTDTFSSTSLRDWGLEVMMTDPYSAKVTSVRPHSLSNGGKCKQ